jgi:hypothetical protein
MKTLNTTTSRVARVLLILTLSSGTTALVEVVFAVVG